MSDGSIIFLDLARQTGWCEGAPGEAPQSGSYRCAPADASPAAVYAGLIDFLGRRLTAFRYRIVAFEAPMDPRHMKTNVNTARLLLGVAAITEGVAYSTGHHRLFECSVHDVRKHLLGQRPEAGKAKRAVIGRLKALGFNPSDDNEADAIAGWLYACAVIDPQRAKQTLPLLSGRA